MFLKGFKEFLKMVELTALSSLSDRAIATRYHSEVFKRRRKISYLFCIYFTAVSNSERVLKIG